jgi:hypothetical protein
VEPPVALLVVEAVWLLGAKLKLIPPPAVAALLGAGEAGAALEGVPKLKPPGVAVGVDGALPSAPKAGVEEPLGAPKEKEGTLDGLLAPKLKPDVVP